jgi:hypothetical protein
MIRFTFALALALSLASCAGGAALQPDRSIFNLDNNYQQQSYYAPIEEIFERTVGVFRAAGYKLDVVDRATGQISGRRGATGDKGSNNDKDLKFYAIITPKEQISTVNLKIVQVIYSGPLGNVRSEIIVDDPIMYSYSFKRIDDFVIDTAPASPSAYDANDGGSL